MAEPVEPVVEFPAGINSITRLAVFTATLLYAALCLVDAWFTLASRPVRWGSLAAVTVTACCWVAWVIGWTRSRVNHPAPLRLTGSGVELTGRDGVQRAIDWADVAQAEVTGRIWPRLVVVPTDPDRLRPAPDPWQRAAVSTRRPYRVVARLGVDRAGRARLSAEMARRTGRPV